MYRGFQLEMTGLEKLDAKYSIAGGNLFSAIIEKVQPSLLKLGSQKKPLDGSLIQNEWFPANKGFDIFISHSHGDRDAAAALAGFLFLEFGLTCFIDSCIWGYADELLKELDEKYCKIDGTDSYSYEARNGSTSHVHMMLTNALAMMIDNSECLFFLNTPKSVTVNDSVKKTQSPWIYTEIGITKWIGKRLHRINPALKKAILETRMMNSTTVTQLKIEYTLSLNHLKVLDTKTLIDWLKKHNEIPRPHALDSLYTLVPA